MTRHFQHRQTICSLNVLSLLGVLDAPTPADLKRINLAVKVLKEACPKCAHTQVGTTEVRLALRVLGPFVDRKWLVEFWAVAVEDPRRPWRTCSTPFDAIVQMLLKRGFVIDAELIPYRLQPD